MSPISPHVPLGLPPDQGLAEVAVLELRLALALASLTTHLLATVTVVVVAATASGAVLLLVTDIVVEVVLVVGSANVLLAIMLMLVMMMMVMMVMMMMMMMILYDTNGMVAIYKYQYSGCSLLTTSNTSALLLLPLVLDTVPLEVPVMAVLR